jgi:hypothetical protein
MKILFSKGSDRVPCLGCARCGQETRLVGIEPHPAIGGIELRIFVCPSCDDGKRTVGAFMTAFSLGQIGVPPKLESSSEAQCDYGLASCFNDSASISQMPLSARRQPSKRIERD